jgi:hypothetical protein
MTTLRFAPLITAWTTKIQNTPVMTICHTAAPYSIFADLCAGRDAKIIGRAPKDKEIAFGMVERGGNVRVAHVATRGGEELQAHIRECVEAGAAIFSDELASYEGLGDDYRHDIINHTVEYVNGNTHTNTIENFWALLKRGLHGTYISVEPFHLFRYIDEGVPVQQSPGH